MEKGGEVYRWGEVASEACDEQRQLRSFARFNRHKEGRERQRVERDGVWQGGRVAALMYGIMAQCHAHTHRHTHGLTWALLGSYISTLLTCQRQRFFLFFAAQADVAALCTNVCVHVCVCTCVRVCLLLRLMINIKPTKRRRTTKCSC